MIVLIRETQGDTLLGAIDGTNVTYVTSLVMDPTYINVFVNGRLKVAAWEDGYVASGMSLVMNEALLPGDSLEVEYRTQTAAGGGAPGGIPAPLFASIVAPTMGGGGILGSTSPTTLNVRPAAVCTLEAPSILTQDQKPHIV